MRTELPEQSTIQMSAICKFKWKRENKKNGIELKQNDRMNERREKNEKQKKMQYRSQMRASSK